MNLHEQLKSLCSNPNPPSSAAEIQTFESALQLTLPKELASLYRNHNGATGCGKSPWRLLPLAEAESIQRTLLEDDVLPGDLVIFAADDEDRLAAYYLAGPLQGHICCFESEEPDSSPKYKTLDSFLEAVITAAQKGQRWPEMPTDLPGPSAPESDALQQLREQHRTATNSRKKRKLAFDIMALIPADRAAELLPFLDDEDLHVQERATELLGKHRYQPAIPRLVEVAKRETTRIHNPRIGAILALGRMKSDAGLKSLFDLAPVIPNGFHAYIIQAFSHHGLPTKLDAGRWKFQMPGSEDWRTL